MIITNGKLQDFYYGAYSFKETEDGYLQAFQYSDAQMDYFKGAFDFWYERCNASTAKTIEFNSECETVSFDYKILWLGSEDSFESVVDGLVTQIHYVNQISKEGRLTFNLPKGKKNVIIYLPSDATVVIKNFEVDGELEKVTKNEKVLWLGDSITQGFGPLRSSCTYVSVANRILNYDIINQGIGGYVYDRKSLMKMPGYTPDKIIVALGTNQYGSETMTDVEEYYETLTEIYGNTIPILTISPIWRGDRPEEFDKFESFCENIKNICRKYANIRIVDGFTLVPHLGEYYRDGLHPNLLGAEVYGNNLVRTIEKIGF